MANDGLYVKGSVWFFEPNKGAAIFFAIAFAVSAGFHLWQTLHYKCWRLTGLYVFCGTIFTAGFITRVIGAFDYEHLIKYIISICLVYAAPPMYELANYYILGRILYYVPYHSPLHPGRVLSTFAAISVVIEALNGNGAAYTVNQSLSDNQRAMGKNMLKAALLMQLIVVALFLVLAIYFHVKCIRNGINNSKVNSSLTTLYVSSTLIVIRTIFRIVEYFDLADVNYWAPGFDPMSMSIIVRYEWFFYIFEGTLMLLNSVLLNVRHPRRWLPKSTKAYLAKDGETELMGPGFKQQRDFFATLIDPFDIAGMISGKKHTVQFWDNDGIVENKTGSNTASTSGVQGPQAV